MDEVCGGQHLVRTLVKTQKKVKIMFYFNYYEYSGKTLVVATSAFGPTEYGIVPDTMEPTESCRRVGTTRQSKQENKKSPESGSTVVSPISYSLVLFR